MARRLAAILAADVVGYSAADGGRRDGHARALKAHRKEFIEPKIAEHPRPHRQADGRWRAGRVPSVVEAVNAPSGSRQGVAERNAGVPEDRRIAFRIGINLGDIIIEDDDIHGDGVNVAARLEALAEPGGICVRAPSATKSRTRSTSASSDSVSTGSRTSRAGARVPGASPDPARWRRRSPATRRHEHAVALARRGRGSPAPGRSWRRLALAALGRGRAAVTGTGGDAGDDLHGTRRRSSRRLWTSTASRCCRSPTSAPIPRTSISPTA